MPRWIFLVAFMLSISVVTGCQAPEAIGKIAKVVVDPDIQVGENADQPSQIALHVYAAADANPNLEKQPSPTILKVFALDGDHRFMSFDFFSLVEMAEETLGVTMKGFLGEAQVVPDQYMILGPYEIPRGTRQIGVIAEFLDIDGTNWRATIDVSDVGADDRLLLLVLEEEIRLFTQER